MQSHKRRNLFLIHLLPLGLLYGCAEEPLELPPPSMNDATSLADLDMGADGTLELSMDLPLGEPRWTKPEGYAGISLTIDDRANRTYSDGQIEWNGSFIYDAPTNTIIYSSSWLPDEGPYPPLYDDGPYDQGGHEALGQTAGDHIFSAEVFFLAEEETTFDYGIINTLDHWIWSGPNGQVTIPADETGTIAAQGLSFLPFGDIDLRVTLDTNQLHPDFPIDPESDAVFLKSSSVSWKPIQLLDNGARGDESPDDGIFTFTLSESLGTHDGLLSMAQETQFVFVFYDAEGVEYKSAGDALKEGVAAFTSWDTEQPGVFLPEELLLNPNSRGQTLNTAITVGPDESIIDSDNPVLHYLEPDSGSMEGGTAVSLIGEHFVDGASVAFDTNVADCTFESSELIHCTTPAYFLATTVMVTVINPGGASTTHPLGFTYLDISEAPTVTGVFPDSGETTGGERVEVTGTYFKEGLTVLFGEELGTEIYLVDETSLWIDVPPNNPGFVDVTVRNTDGQTGLLENGYTYLSEAIDWATIQYPNAPIDGIAQTPLPTLYGRVYEAGITDGEGAGSGIKAQVVVAPEGAASPEEDDSQWTPYEMVYKGDLDNDDEYELEDLTLNDAGTYYWAVRFSINGGVDWLYGDLDGSDNGFDVLNTGTIHITDDLAISSISPGTIPNEGSAEIVVLGNQFSEEMFVSTRTGEADFTAVDITITDSTEMVLNIPDTAPGTNRSWGFYDLEIRKGETSLIVENAYAVGLFRSPHVDGVLSFGMDDWDESFLQGSNDIESDWGESSLFSAYAGFDSAGLYLAVELTLERDGIEDPGNVFLAYIDTDYGEGTGFDLMDEIGDEDSEFGDDIWRLDRAISSNIDATNVSGYGAEYALGSFEISPLEGADYHDEITGIRRLVAENLWWYSIEDGGNSCSYENSCDETGIGPICLSGAPETADQPGVIETFIPWCVLYNGQTSPPEDSQLALFIRIVNSTGDFSSNQTLPYDPAFEADSSHLVNEVMVFDVY